MDFHQIYRVTLISLIAAVVSGCASNNPRPVPAFPSNSETVNNGGSNSRQNDESWEISDQVYEGEDIGLKQRDQNLSDEVQNRNAEEVNSSSGAQQVDGPNPNAIASVYFGFDQTAIKTDQREKLKNVAQQMEDNSNLELLVEGHCDWRGTTNYNIALGERRAKSVVDYLSRLGVNNNRFEILSKGDLEATEEATSGQMRQDRRVDVIPIQ